MQRVEPLILILSLHDQFCLFSLSSQILRSYKKRRAGEFPFSLTLQSDKELRVRLFLETQEPNQVLLLPWLKGNVIRT